MSIEAKINELGHTLPEVPAPAGSYVNYTRSGNLLFLAGGIPPVNEEYTGKVPTDTSLETAQEAARIITLNRLAVVKEAVGSLDKVKQIVTVNGFVNSEPDFYGHPSVINGCSDLLVEIFGDKGIHSRTAMGAAALPLNVSVEINMVVEVED
ncbi:MAG: RidA family protein [Rubritalea sp.]|jgi:enamine deaminase RidA (YjgF/YER057c/UK114 family)|tara:strand:+ start:6121 stop:6576 length:456 start_codon:yes stop_codon:yes gene_type:complete